MLSGITTTALFLATNRSYWSSDTAVEPEQPLVEVPMVPSVDFISGEGKVQLMPSHDGSEEMTYASLLVEATRPQMAYVLDFVMFTSCFGATVSYFIFLAGFLRTFPGWPLGAPPTIVLLGVVLYPLGVPKTVGVISKLGNLSLAAMIALASGIVYRAGPLAEERAAPMYAVTPDVVANAPQVMCICLFAFSWHINAVPTGAALSNPTP